MMPSSQLGGSCSFSRSDQLDWPYCFRFNWVVVHAKLLTEGSSQPRRMCPRTMTERACWAVRDRASASDFSQFERLVVRFRFAVHRHENHPRTCPISSHSASLRDMPTSRKATVFIGSTLCGFLAGLGRSVSLSHISCSLVSIPANLAHRASANHPIVV